MRGTHGYSSAAMVPAGVPSTAGVAEAATVVQEESDKSEGVGVEVGGRAGGNVVEWGADGSGWSASGLQGRGKRLWDEKTSFKQLKAHTPASRYAP